MSATSGSDDCEDLFDFGPLETEGIITKCPNCEEEAFRHESEIFLGECYGCNYLFCTNCNQDFHGHSECNFNPTAEDLCAGFEFVKLEKDEEPKPEVFADGKFGTFECQICFESKSNEEAADLGCEHLNCLPCVRGYFESLINQKEVHGFKCPSDNKCKAEITPNTLKLILSYEMFAKYDNILLDESLKDDPEIVSCPKCEERFHAKPEFGYCEVCDYRFCTDCMKAYHGVTPCSQTEEERIALIKQHLAADEAERERLELLEREKRRKEIEENDRFVKEYAKKCPACRADIEKIDGCHHMTCKCNTHFCWLCLQVISPTNPYKHFEGACALFDVPKG